MTTNLPKYKRPVEPEFRRLRKEVDALVKSLESGKKPVIKLKAVLFPLLYIAAYVTLLAAGENPWVFYLSYLSMGLLIIMNFLNLIHDAVHGVVFKNSTLNKIYLHFFDLLGANSFIWKIRHIRLHHSFPNIMNWDSDFEQSPLVRVFPHAKAEKFHKYQHIYLPFLYPMYLFNWLLVRDFKDFFKKDTLVHKVAKIPKVEYVKLFVFKIVFIGYTLIAPKLVLGLGWGVILSGWGLMIFAASIFSLVVLLSPHANTHSEFPEPDPEGNLPYSWFKHQLVCTNDVTNDSFFIRFFMGSFNYHIAHHLFPDVHHSYYPEITKLLEKFAQEHDLPYSKQSLFQSLRSHYQLLRQNAVDINIFEETM